MEFLFVNYVLYILYISKIYNKLMYVCMQTLFGDLGIKHRCVKLSVGPSYLPPTTRLLYCAWGEGKGAGATSETLGAASQISRQAAAGHQLSWDLLPLLGFGAHLEAPFIQH